MKRIQFRKREIEKDRLLKYVKDIENSKDDSKRMFQVIRLNNHKINYKIFIQNNDGRICTGEEANEVIITYFKNQLQTDYANGNYDKIMPMKMTNSFTMEEVKSAISPLKANKSFGTDGIYAEYLKLSPTIIHHTIARILNNVAEYGNFPTELRDGHLYNPHTETR